MFLAGISFLVALRKEDLQYVTKVRGVPDEAVSAGEEARERGEIVDLGADEPEDERETARA